MLTPTLYLLPASLQFKSMLLTYSSSCLHASRAERIQKMLIKDTLPNIRRNAYQCTFFCILPVTACLRNNRATLLIKITVVSCLDLDQFCDNNDKDDANPRASTEERTNFSH